MEDLSKDTMVCRNKRQNKDLILKQLTSQIRKSTIVLEKQRQNKSNHNLGKYDN